MCMSFQQWCDKYNITVKIEFVKFDAVVPWHDDNSIEFDQWDVQVSNTWNRTISFPYFTGKGNRSNKLGSLIFKKYTKDSPLFRDGVWFYSTVGRPQLVGYPKIPSVMEFFEGLRNNIDALEQSFEEFCSEFGYDVDSRRAFDTYSQCRDNSLKLAQLIGLTGLNELRAVDFDEE